ncbi:hypothetical protein NUW58_g4588 [Xylaria curta]|uniref:Uncharacterized protein n=1 Tax=Xylaria curta TaxID=42375 RepID=A0ACC1P6M9_9PEZI|nr:hypothetical protein NUW58_g4588 [Xylaria curta]
MNERLILSWLVFAIGYVVAFPTLWAAATGYSSPSITAYNLSNKAYVPVTSGDLRLCWGLNDNRLNGSVASIVLGPPFHELYTFNRTHVPRPDDPWEISSAPITDFVSILNCELPALFAISQFGITYQPSQDAKTKHSLQNYLKGNATDKQTQHLENMPTVPRASWNSSDIYIQGSWDGLTFYEGRDRSALRPPPGFSPVIDGYQYTPGSETLQETTFSLNITNTIQTNTLYGFGEIPYNSTLFLKNAMLPLTSPFLEFGLGTDFSCTWWNSSMGECPCYLGTPLSEDWAIEPHWSCLGIQGNIWGFSSLILLVSLILEVIWLIGNSVLGWRMTVHSNLLKHNRRNTGLVRHILDLAETINRDLGPNTCGYTDEELRYALNGCPPVGYDLQDMDGLKHLTLSTGIHGNPPKPEMEITFKDVFG